MSKDKLAKAWLENEYTGQMNAETMRFSSDEMVLAFKAGWSHRGFVSSTPQVPHEYVEAQLGHSNKVCKWCAGTPAENSVIAPNHCEKRPVFVGLDLASEPDTHVETVVENPALMAGRIERLRRILARYGDRVPMAMCHRADWQQEIDEAMEWVASNPEVDR